MRTPVRSCGRGRRRIPTAPRWTRNCGGPPCRPPSTTPVASTTWPPFRWAPSSTAWCAWTNRGEVVRDALLWNDTRSSAAAAELVDELGGASGVGEAHRRGAGRRDHGEQTALARRPRTRTRRRHRRGVPAARLADVAAERLDRYRRAAHRPQRRQRDRILLRRSRHLPTRSARAGDARTAARRCRRCSVRTTPPARRPSGATLGPGAGDNAAAALGLGAQPGDCIVSLGTSGVVSAVGHAAPHDAEGIVAGFADATGRQLPLVCTLNGAPVLAAVATMLGVDFDELDRLALSAPAGAGGLTLVPYLEGERSPNLPNAAGALHGMTARNLTAANIARAGVEGLLVLAGVLPGQDLRAGRRRRADHPGGRRGALRGGPRCRACDLRQARARAHAGGVCGAGRGPAGGLDTVAVGFAAGMVVRNHHDVHRRPDAGGARPVSAGSAADAGATLTQAVGRADRVTNFAVFSVT